jgi:dihydrodipicolinate synthase/N-acetylneuraminate lyase
MPIEIKELHIKIHVDDKNETNGVTTGGDTGESVTKAVEETMELLRLQKER